MTDGTPKLHRAGTHRAELLSETLRRIAPLLPAMGITRIADVTGLDRIGLPVVMVVRPNARSLSVHQGKGLDLVAAKVSGAMEAVECFHAEHVTRPVRLASLDEMAREAPLVDVADLPQRKGATFPPHRRIPWIEGRDLLDGGTLRWVPHEVVHADYTLPLPPGSGALQATTNGLASGNTLAEAAAHALAELVERDARALWWLRDPAAQRASALDLASVDDPDCAGVLGRLERTGMAVTVWDVTSDLSVPTFLCRMAEAGGPGDGGAYGAGTHPERGIALLRALTEAAQSRLTRITGSRDDLLAGHYEGYAGFERDVFEEMAPRRGDPLRRFRDVPSFEGATLEEDLDWLLARLASARLRQAVLVELTRPEFDIPVVRMIVPGLEGMHTKSGYAPGPRARALLGASA
ncbi:MAG TPA: YcaO-like family protein [Falsiroseomonas sp.]|nr:YcaO-like family protein [Falsiroseomonas sp.]